jgi:acyl carrier protein
MTHEEIYTKASQAIANVLNIEPSTITKDSSFEQLGVDSLDMIQIIMRFEETFSIDKIEDEQAAQMKTVGDAVNALDSMINKK